MKRYTLLLALSFVFGVAMAQSGYGTDGDFNPENPAIPGPNGFYPDEGLLVLDGIRNGDLSSAAQSIFYANGGGSEGGQNNAEEMMAKVKKIVVCGEMNPGDEYGEYGTSLYFMGRMFKNLEELDLSRTYGWKDIYSIDEIPTLKVLHLPDCIDNVYSLENLKLLTDVYCYAELPPVLTSLYSSVRQNLFFDPTSVTVHVPESSIAFYQAAEGWKDATIVALENGVSKISVKMPAGIDLGLYRGMNLTLIDETSGLTTRYVTTDRTSYIFPGLQNAASTTWAVTLTNRFGSTVASVSGIKTDASTTNVDLANLKPVVSGTVKVLDADGKDVTANTAITWFDKGGLRLNGGNALAGFVKDDQALVEVKLPAALARTYAQPSKLTVTAGETNADATVQLRKMQKNTVTAILRDKDTKHTLSNISVTAIQTYADGCTASYTAETDARGQFSVEVLEGPMTITFASEQYARKEIEANTASAVNGTVDLGEISIKQAGTTCINMILLYYESAVEGDEAAKAQPYPYYEDVQYTIYNVNTKKYVTDFYLRGNQIVIQEELGPFDCLNLTLSSVSNSFAPVEAAASLSNGIVQEPLTVRFFELGGFKSTFKSTANNSVAAALYDSNGKLVNRYVHSSATLTVMGIPAGDYTLVTMANDPLLTKLPSLESFAEMGLTSGKDYAQNSFHVTDGLIKLLENTTIPTLDVEQYKILHGSSTFSFTDSKILEGGYVTLRTRLKLKNEYASSWKYSDFYLVIDLPDGCSYLDGSLLINGNSMSCTARNGQIKVTGISSLLESGDFVDIRLCLVAAENGRKNVSGKIVYDYMGEQFAAPAGTATYTTSALEYNITDQSYNGHVTASGTCVPGSKITVLDDGKPIAQKTVTGDCWAIDELMADNTNLSVHPVTITCETKEGNVYTSPTTLVLVDKDLNHVSKVTMIYPNAYSGYTAHLVFDFITPDTKAETYDYFPSSRDFTFVIDFLKNDTTEVGDVKLVVEMSDESFIQLPAAFDEARQAWVANLTVPEENHDASPVDVMVSFTQKAPVITASRQKMDEGYAEVKDIIDELSRLIQILSDFNEDNVDQKMAQYDAAVGYGFDTEPTAEDLEWSAWFNSLSPEAAQTEIDRVLAESALLLDTVNTRTSNILAGIPSNLSYFVLDDGSEMFIRDCSGYDESTILDRGFTAQPVDDNTNLYILDNDEHCIVVDFKENRAVEFVYSPNHVKEGVVSTCLDGIAKVEGLIRDLTGGFNTLMNGVTGQIASLLAHQAALEKVLYQCIMIGTSPYSTALQKAAAHARMVVTKVALRTTDISLKFAKAAPSLLRRIVPVVQYLSIAADFISTFKEIASLYLSIPDPCRDDQAAANTASDMLMTGAQLQIAYSAGKLALQIASDMTVASSVVAAIPSGGLSSITGVAAYLGKAVGMWVMDKAFAASQSERCAQAKAIIGALECEQDEPEEEHPLEITGYIPHEFDWHYEKPKGKKKKPLIDPSGFVCEAVESNRLEGVTATVYYKAEVEDMYGEKTQQTVIWDAENYGQENPLLTDAQGMYSWMVPAGQWQVEYQKEGYETMRSAWLPVPPPQLDVNVAMTRYAQPEIAEASATQLGIGLNFSLYMQTATVNGLTVTVTQDGNPVAGKLEAVNAEDAFGDGSQQFASQFRYATDRQLAVGSKVLVKVSSLVRSYAGIALGEDIEKELVVGREITSLNADTLTTVRYGGSHQLVIKAQPAEAASMKTVTIRMESEDIAGIETNTVVLDNQGQAYVTIYGRLPGTAYMYFTMEGSKFQGVTKVQVIKDNAQIPDAPRASLISGTYVAPGTKVELTAQDGCTIWYTLDGSCPCDEAKRIRYTGPITIEADTHLRALAQAADGTESESVTFTWFVASTDIEEIILVPVDPEAIYDLQGRKLTGAPQGIYIRSGKKILK